jgi:hypothetical protein
MLQKYEVTGFDRDGCKVFHLLVEAPTEQVAKLYATASLERTPDGANAVRKAAKIEAIAK